MQLSIYSNYSTLEFTINFHVHSVCGIKVECNHFKLNSAQCERPYSFHRFLSEINERESRDISVRARGKHMDN